MATQALRYLSQTDGFLPGPTGQVISYIRKESEFPLNKYVQYVPSDYPYGVYAVLGRDQFVRVQTDERFAWEDGDARPDGEWNKIPFQWADFRTFRRTYPWTIGYKALQTTTKYGSWMPKPAHTAMAVSQAMTNRTNRVAKLLQTAANWPTSNTGSANTVNGGLGNWVTASDDPTSAHYLAIYTTLVNAAQNINLLTNAKVTPADLVCVVSPGLAKAMSRTGELVNYCRESPAARELVEKGYDPQYTLWGLPSTYKGFKFIVENTPFVNVNPNTTTQSGTAGQVPEAPLSTTGRQYAWLDSTAVLVSRVGGIDGEGGTPSFSTVQLYHYGPLMQVEAREDTWNRRIEGGVSEDYTAVLAAAFAGYNLTGCM